MSPMLLIKIKFECFVGTLLPLDLPNVLFEFKKSKELDVCPKTLSMRCPVGRFSAIGG